MTMSLSISNIAWPHDARSDVYDLLRRKDITGIEMAFTKIAPWDKLTKNIIKQERSKLEHYGLRVSSYQALYFGLPELQLLGDDAKFHELAVHTRMVAKYAEQLSNGGAGVFGAPRNRLMGSLHFDEAFDLGAKRFYKLANIVQDFNFVIVLEPAPEQYGGDFLTTPQECADMVRAVDHPAFRLHLDTGCMSISGTNIDYYFRDHVDIIEHVHLSMPRLSPIDVNCGPIIEDLIKSLRFVDYERWATIEMRETKNFMASIEQALDVAIFSLSTSGR